MTYDTRWDDFNAGLSSPCPHPVGTRIELISMPDDPDPIPAGTRGTVTGGNGAQMYVDWDINRSLILIPGKDTYRVITENEGDRA